MEIAMIKLNVEEDRKATTNNKAITNPKEDVQAKYSNTPPKGKIDTNTSYRSRDIKCFMCQGVGQISSQCRNKRAMIMIDNGDIKSESSSDDEMPPLEDCSDVEVTKPVYGVVLVTRRALSIQPKEDDDVDQHKHIFCTRCHINGKVSIDVFLQEVSHGLPPLRGIEHQIDLIPSSPIPNRLAYRKYPKEIKEIQKQVNELLQKGFVKKSLSPCSIPMILVLKKYGT
ncbi:hypothetical protein CR513_05429, partial [Mucuna pruriens]